MKKYLLERDLSEENWTRLPFKDDMLIHVKKAFSRGGQGRRKGSSVTFIWADLHLHPGYRGEILMSKFASERRVFGRLFNLLFFYGVVDVLFLIAFNWHFISPLKNSLRVCFTLNIAAEDFCLSPAE